MYGGLNRTRAEAAEPHRIVTEVIPLANSLEHEPTDMAVFTRFTCADIVTIIDCGIWFTGAYDVIVGVAAVISTFSGAMITPCST